MINRAKTSSANRLQITCILVTVTVMVVAVGCTRDHYRRQADREVYSLVDCAASDPRWPMDDFTIEPDPASRFYDPDNPNCPPMPPDDPTSHGYMQCVDCKKGWPHWHDHGNTSQVENPAWLAYLPMDENGVVVLDRVGVVRTARIHSRNYQRELENLYLSALDVTFERFRFDCQFFGGNSTFYTADGHLRSGSSSSLLNTDTDLQMRRLFAPGGELVVGVANSLVWQFAGPDSYGANTLLDFSLVQPLLRAGGRQVVLEDLTAGERALLAEIRDFERFRNEFHISVIGGLGGFRAGGYWALLRSQVEINNQISNVAALQDSVNRFQAGYESGKDKLQSVEQARQRLYGGQSRLLSLKASYENSLELFLMDLGLPPDLDVGFDDNSLERFNLRDPAITDTRKRVETALDPLRDPAIAELPDDFRDRTAAMRAECEPLLNLVERDLQILVDVLPERSMALELLSSRKEFERGEVDSRVADVAELNRRVVERFADFYGPEFPAVNDLVGRLLTTEEDLKWFMEYKSRQNNITGLGAEIVRTLLEIESFEEDPEAITASVNAVALQEQAASRPDVEAELPAAERQELDELDVKTPKEVLADLMGLLSSQLLEMSLVQAQARLDAVTLVPIELDPHKAFEIARTHRRDWMNARADLVDTWRQIEVRANALESSVDVTFSGDMGTTDNQPLRFRAPTGRLRVGMQFDAPLTRTAERNAYRQALIGYQQARRDYYAFEDGINQSLRNLLRTMRRNQLDFEITRQSVFIAVTRVDEARIGLEKPVSSQAGPRSTAGTRDLLDALDRLLVEQNGFLGAWVDYEVLRMNLDLDLGTMELDDRGMWIDPGSITDDTIGAGGLEVIPTPPGAILPGKELTPPVPESVQVPPLEALVPDGEAQHAAFVERAPAPPKVTSISLPVAL
jgi:outer membrane protein TolC